MPGHARLELAIDVDVAALQPQAELLGAEAVVTGPRPVATSRYSAVELAWSCRRRFAPRSSTPSAPAFALVTFVPVSTLMPCFLNDRLELGRHRLVLDRHQPRQQLDDRDLAAEAPEDRRELDADRAAAHDHDRLRDSPSGRSLRRW